jgi:kinesin family protein 2/24
MNSNQQQLLACLHTGQTVDIQRSNGRIHQAVITQINHETKSVTVEWQEKNEGKGKEVDLDAIVQLNPNLFTSITNSSSSHNNGAGEQEINNNGDHYTNGGTVSHPNRRTKQQNNDNETARKQSQPPPPPPAPPARPAVISNPAVQVTNDASPQKQFQQNPSVISQQPPIDSNKSKVVKEIERIAANREQRRAKQDERRQKLSEVDQSIPAWEFQAMVSEYRQQLDTKLLQMNEPQKDLKICVCVRKRPITKKELGKKDIDVLTIPNKEVVIVHLPKVKVDLTKYIDNQKFRFDYGFHETCNNELVYHFTAQPLVQSLFQGNNPMVFAYGQTGSGKTYTMGGDLSQRDVDFSKGIYALTANDIFRHLNKPPNKGQFDVYCTFFEIYCTKVFDLFNEKKRLRVLEDHKNLVQVVGKKEEQVETVEDVMTLIRRGMSVRTSGTTSANENSSRSHAVFQITLKKKNMTKEYGKISLIDLAGSERGRDTQTNDKVTLMEGAQINKSLLTLKECIRSLGRNAEHIPFRGSTLTKVLRDSFIGERSKVCMIAMVSPGNSDVEHTLNTLRYADRVKELNVDELKQRGAGNHPGQAIGGHDDMTLGQPLYEEDDMDDDDDVDELTGINVNNNNQVMPTSRYGQSSNIPKAQQPTNNNNNNNNKRSLGNKQKSEVTRKFEEAIARSQEIEDVTLESHNELIDDLPQIVANHQSLLDLSTNMNYDRDEYAKQLINLIDSQQQFLTDLRNKALQMREAVAYEDLCAKGLSSK